MTRITAPCPSTIPRRPGRDGSSAAEAAALSTQTAAVTRAPVSSRQMLPTSAANESPAAAPVGSTGAVAQSNDASATSTAAAASDAVQSVLQGELFGSTAGAIPAVAQHLDVTQFAAAQSSSIQADAQNIAVVDLSPGIFVGVTQANEAQRYRLCRGHCDDLSGKRAGSGRKLDTTDDLPGRDASLRPARPVAAVAQAGVTNTAVVEAARPITAARETTTPVAPDARAGDARHAGKHLPGRRERRQLEPHRADRCSASRSRAPASSSPSKQPTSLSSHRQRQRQTRQEARTSSSPTSSSRRSLPSAQSRRRISI